MLPGHSAYTPLGSLLGNPIPDRSYLSKSRWPKSASRVTSFKITVYDDCSPVAYSPHGWCGGSWCISSCPHAACHDGFNPSPCRAAQKLLLMVLVPTGLQIHLGLEKGRTRRCCEAVLCLSVSPDKEHWGAHCSCSHHSTSTLTVRTRGSEPHEPSLGVSIESTNIPVGLPLIKQNLLTLRRAQ